MKRKRRKRKQPLAKNCWICKHPQRQQIHQSIQRLESITSTAKKYRLPYASLWRHLRAGHVEALAEPVITSPRDQVRYSEGELPYSKISELALERASWDAARRHAEQQLDKLGR